MQIKFRVSEKNRIEIQKFREGRSSRFLAQLGIFRAANGAARLVRDCGHYIG